MDFHCPCTAANLSGVTEYVCLSDQVSYKTPQLPMYLSAWEQPHICSSEKPVLSCEGDFMYNQTGKVTWAKTTNTCLSKPRQPLKERQVLLCGETNPFFSQPATLQEQCLLPRSQTTGLRSPHQPASEGSHTFCPGFPLL